MNNNIEQSIQNLDLTSVLDRAQAKLGLDGEMAKRAEELYKQYLILRARYPEEPLAPPKLADEIWHYHITDTQKYQQDCEQLFGEFVHHMPATGDDKAQMEKLFGKTCELYKKEFGIDLQTEGFASADCSTCRCT